MQVSDWIYMSGVGFRSLGGNKMYGIICLQVVFEVMRVGGLS